MRRRSAEEATLNLTPMIDVVFLLVIFFMVGAKFTEQESQIPINLPGVGQLNPMVRGPDRRTVDLTPDGQVTLDGQPVSLAQLRSDLQVAHASYPDLQVSVRADASESLARFTEILHVCRSSGVENLGIAVQPQRR
ncbi:biopolymer transport protein ExbD [Roseimaritima multifibrata]|uniref:Biopolymer transport protein ExbD n=1 Tax=Roseimaritima multifibrata TaxID=1930274 RepID=A0A517MB00_9BACT|nr:biopolymer transporter ExbD [Roseimaritima multifibrata]QDS92060.1 biopolymer transport protein ExbD [Roseimaritima multifibrata]